MCYTHTRYILGTYRYKCTVVLYHVSTYESRVQRRDFFKI